MKNILASMISIIYILFSVGSAGADPAEAIPVPVYKEMRPKKTPFDPDKIPDPFLSYLVKRGQQASARAADEKKKKLAAEEALKREKLAAEEALKRKKLAAAEQLKDLLVARTELQKLGLSQLTLTAIVQAGEVAWAMVRDAKGKGYVLKKGTRIGNKGGVVFRIAGKEKRVVIKEPYLEKELHIKYKRVDITLPDQVYE